MSTKVLNTNVLKRFLNAVEFEALVTKYNDARYSQGTGKQMRAATSEDHEILKSFKEGATIYSLAKKHGVSTNKIRNSIIVAAR